MKIKTIFVVLLIIILSGCSVRENMNTEIFFDRLSAVNKDFDYENLYEIKDGADSLNFIKDMYSNEFLLSMSLSDSDDINKISFACLETDKAENFIKYMRDIISVYSPSENADQIIKELTENGKIKTSYTYYETKWYLWSAFCDENGLYFSVVNKKFSVFE